MLRAGMTAALAASVLVLGGCGSGPSGKAKAEKEDVYDGGLDLRRIVGTVKNPPDEFAVIAKRPLEMPDDFAALPPPQPGARSPRDPDPLTEARAALLRTDGSATETASRTSVSEAALLNAAGASDPNIRTALAADQQAYEDEQDLYVLDRVIPALRRLRGEEDRNLVNPIEEYQRLNTAAASPAARTARSTPVAVIPSAPLSRAPSAELPATPSVPAPVPAAPSASTAPPAAGTDGELIYIPE